MSEGFDPRWEARERDREARRRRRRMLGGGTSLAVHALAFAAIFWVHQPAPDPPEAPAMQASLVELPKPQPPEPPAPVKSPKPPEPPKPTLAKAGGRHSAVRPTPIRIHVPTMLAAAKTPKPDTSDLLSASELAGATSVGEGGGGGGGGAGGNCDMAAMVQRALRKDPLVQSAVFDAGRSGQAIKVWNGGWVKSGDQDGKGLAAVREAILWEVGFAPEACRREPRHGLVLLSLNGGTRIAVGGPEWRWQDLLALR